MFVCLMGIWGSRRNCLKIRNSTEAFLRFMQIFTSANMVITTCTERFANGTGSVSRYVCLVQVIRILLFSVVDKHTDESVKRWILQFLLQHLTDNQLSECHLSIVAFFQTASNHSKSPPLIFLLIRFLNRFILMTTAANQDQFDKICKPLQSIFINLLDSINVIVASSLEPLSWLKRNSIVVKNSTDSVQALQLDNERTMSNCTDDMFHSVVTDGIVGSVMLIQSDPKEIHTYSLQAITVLAQTMVDLIDNGFKNDEKDRLCLPIVNNICSNLFPFLKTRRQSNAPKVRACSSLLHSLSSSNWTKKLVRKDVMDAVFSNDFFKLDLDTFQSWCQIVNNLSFTDKVTFKEIISRASSIQTGLFISADQENEQRSQMIRRVAFIIFASSEKDTFQVVIPELQDFLSDMLRLTQNFQMQCQIFNLIRCMILRFSPKYLVAILPVIYTELIGVMIQLEGDVNKSISIESASRLLINVPLQQSPSFNKHTCNQADKLGMYLSALKLLEVLLTWPADHLPQFQMYRYVFCPRSRLAIGNLPSQSFRPYLLRIRSDLDNVVTLAGDNMVQQIVTRIKDDTPYLSFKTIQSLEDLLVPIRFLEEIEFRHRNWALSDCYKVFDRALADDFSDGWIHEK
ncbi:hypothetical protein GJ496_005670 [Pomphorhynchus laevis]|nr:hypothetical protein GJ496_005670 [Pomphorhynchus laevis]